MSEQTPTTIALEAADSSPPTGETEAPGRGVPANIFAPACTPVDTRSPQENSAPAEGRSWPTPERGRMVADERLETPKQLAARVNVSERQIRNLIRKRDLDHVMIGARVHIPVDAWRQFIERRRARSWQDGTKEPSSDGAKIEVPSTSFGQSTVAAASARLAQQTAKKLKTSSRNGSTPEASQPAQVIRLKS